MYRLRWISQRKESEVKRGEKQNSKVAVKVEGVRKSSIQVKRLTLISFVCNRKEEKEKMCLSWVIRIFFFLSLYERWGTIFCTTCTGWGRTHFGCAAIRNWKEANRREQRDFMKHRRLSANQTAWLRTGSISMVMELPLAVHRAPEQKRRKHNWTHPASRAWSNERCPGRKPPFLLCP